MLKPEYVKSTLEALRSGKYKQAHGVITTGHNEYCCIGVAAVANGFTGIGFAPLHGTHDCAEYLGLDDQERTEWVNWNDIQGYDFPTIANLIQTRYGAGQ